MADSPFKRGSESALTYRLKWAAWEWLYTCAQCRSIGLEVRLEGPGGRVVDLVGIGPNNLVYIIEVKSSRSDFGRDNHTTVQLEELRAKAAAIARRIELTRLILEQAEAYARKQQPELWQGVIAYRQALADYQRIAKEGENYRARLATFSAKFHDPRFLAIADYHYLMAPSGVVPRSKLPPQWGLLNDIPATVVAAPRKAICKNTGIISNILRAIARSSTTAMMRAHGVYFTEDGAVFPGDEVSESAGRQPEAGCDNIPAPHYS